MQFPREREKTHHRGGTPILFILLYDSYTRRIFGTAMHSLSLSPNKKKKEKGKPRKEKERVLVAPKNVIECSTIKKRSVGVRVLNTLRLRLLREQRGNDNNNKYTSIRACVHKPERETDVCIVREGNVYTKGAYRKSIRNPGRRTSIISWSTLTAMVIFPRTKRKVPENVKRGEQQRLPSRSHKPLASHTQTHTRSYTIGAALCEGE